MMKFISKFLVDLMFTNEISDKDMSKSHQVIGPKIVRIFKLELIFSFIDIIVIKFSYDKIVVNFVNSTLLGVITQSQTEISVT